MWSHDKRKKIYTYKRKTHNTIKLAPSAIPYFIVLNSPQIMRCRYDKNS